MTSAPSKDVHITVDAEEWRGELAHNWNYIGYDEVNYTYVPEGHELLAKFAQLRHSSAKGAGHSVILAFSEFRRSPAPGIAEFRPRSLLWVFGTPSVLDGHRLLNVRRNRHRARASRKACGVRSGYGPSSSAGRTSRAHSVKPASSSSFATRSGRRRWKSSEITGPPVRCSGSSPTWNASCR